MGEKKIEELERRIKALEHRLLDYPMLSNTMPMARRVPVADMKGTLDDWVKSPTLDTLDVNGTTTLNTLTVNGTTTLNGGIVFNAEIGVHTHQSDIQGGKLDHGLALVGLLDDDHTQYAHAEGSGIRYAYGANRLNKSVLAGNGLTGGGLLTADVTLNVGAGTLITVGADSVGLSNGTAQYQTIVTGASPFTPAYTALSSLAGNGLGFTSNFYIDQAYNFLWTGTHTFGNTATFNGNLTANNTVNLKGQTNARHIIPEATDTYDLGTSLKLWRKGWLSELDTILFTQNTMTLLGGWFVVSKGEGALPANVAAADTTIDFGQTMTVNDFVVFRSSLQAEYIQVGTLVSGTTYNVTRNLDGSGANDWVAGQPYMILGQSGNGRIELNAYNTPRIQLLKQGATYNAQTELIRIGDLNGNWGYTAEKWGVAIGEYATDKPNIVIDADGIMKFRLYTTDVMTFAGGNADITGKLRMPGTDSAIAIGATPPTGSAAGTGIWIDRTGLYSLNAGIYQVKIDATTGKLYAGNGKVRLDSTGIILCSDYDEEIKMLLVDYNNLEYGAIIWKQNSYVSQELKLQSGGTLILGNSVASTNYATLEAYATTIKSTYGPSIYLGGQTYPDRALISCGYSYIDTMYGMLALDYQLPNTATVYTKHNTIVPLGYAPPWLVAPEALQFIVHSWNPIVNTDFTIRDLGVPPINRRDLTAYSSWSGHASYSSETLGNLLEYYGTNSTNLYYYNTSGLPLWVANRWYLNVIMWFHPNGSGGALRGLFQHGTTTINFDAYINTYNNIVFEIIDTAGVTKQVVSNNTVTYDAWNYIILRYAQNYTMWIILNGTKTTYGGPITNEIRAGAGDFRLGWTAYAGPLNGQFGWTMFGVGWQPTDEFSTTLIDLSRPWHRGGA